MNKQTYIIAICIFIMATGGYAAMPLFVVMTKVHGISLVQVGILTAVYIFSQKVTPIIFGLLGDYYGHRKMACIGEALRGIGFIGLGLCGQYPLLCLCAAIAGVGGGVAGPSLRAMIMLSSARIFRQRVSALRATADNSAIIAGPLLGGLSIFLGHLTAIFLTAGICYLLGIGLLLIFTTKNHVPPSRSLNPFSIYKKAWTNHRLIHIMIYMFFIWLLYAQIFVSMPEYANSFTSHIEQLFLINGVIGVLFQYPISRWCGKTTQPHWSICFGTLLFMLTFFILGLIQGSLGLYIGIILFTFGELLIFPMAETMIANLSSDGKNIAAYFGISSLSDGLGRPAGSFIGALLFENITYPRAGWYLFSAFCLGLLIYGLILFKSASFRKRDFL